MKSIFQLLFLSVLVTLYGCDQGVGEDTYSAAFVTTLGDDTLALEKFNRNGDIFKASVMLRVPRTSVKSYTLQLEEGKFKRMEVLNYDPIDLKIIKDQKELIFIQGDNLVREVTDGTKTTTSKIKGDGSMLPFIDMVHWPIEIALASAVKSENDSVIQYLFTTRRARPFVIHKTSAVNISFRHPTRGVMDIIINDDARITRIDASKTTRKVVVSRIDDIQLMKIAAEYAQQDAQGKSFGALSGRGKANINIGGVDIEVDYGTPSKRGRVIFGNIVKWGEVWRTGANRATHLKSSGDINLGDCKILAGEYTIFTIPEDEGGVLIINLQTNMGGTGYDEENDYCRTGMVLNTLENNQEVFQIIAEETELGGELKIQWDNFEFKIPITVGTAI